MTYAVSTGFVSSGCAQFVDWEGEISGSGVLLPEGHRYLEWIGSLQFLSCITRPDISQAVVVLSRFRVQQTTAHWNGAIRVLKYLIGTKDLGLVYGKGQNSGVECYVDDDVAGDSDSRKSTRGFVFFVKWFCSIFGGVETDITDITE